LSQVVTAWENFQRVVCVKLCKLAIMVVTELNEAGQAASLRTHYKFRATA